MIYVRILIIFFLCELPFNLKGQNWNEFQSASVGQYFGIHMLDDCSGFAVGAQYTFHKTNDGGRTWVSLGLTDTPQFLDDIWFYDTNNGWAWGYNGVIFKTNDAGTTWEKSNFFGSYSIYDLTFINLINGFATGTGMIFKTSDGGLNWTPILIPNLAGLSITSIRFTSPMTGFITAGDSVYTSLDSGATWNAINAATGNYFNGLEFVTPNDIFAYDNAGSLLLTHDAGLSWIILNLSSYPITNAHKIDENNVYLSTNSGDYIENHDGGGYGWMINTRPIAPLVSVQDIFVTPTQVLLAGYRQISTSPYYTTWLMDSTICLNAIKENYPTKYLYIFPNPATDKIYINGLKENEYYSISIYTMVGQHVKDIPTISNNTAINIGDLPLGIYSIRIFIKNKSFQNSLILIKK